MAGFVLIVLVLCSVLQMTSGAAETYLKTVCLPPNSKVKPNEPVNVTFIFFENLRETKDNFCVYRKCPITQKIDKVVACNWKDDGETVCFMKEGVSLVTQNVTTKLVVRFDKVRNGMKFSSNTVPGDENTVVEECSVEVEDDASLPSDGSGATANPTSGTDKTVEEKHAFESATNTEEKVAASDKVVIVIGVLLCVSLAANLLLVLVVCKRRMASNNGKPMKTPKHQPQGRRHIFWVCLSSCSKSNSHLRDGEQGETVCVDMEKDNLSTEHALANGRGITANHTSQPFLPSA